MSLRKIIKNFINYGDKIVKRILFQKKYCFLLYENKFKKKMYWKKKKKVFDQIVEISM